MTASLDAGALDACCFHAQQAAEKCLKAYLIHVDVEFPFTHNLLKLIELAVQTDPAFETLTPQAVILTPYAVELRYDGEFWPTTEVAQEACGSAGSFQEFVLARLPRDVAGEKLD